MALRLPVGGREVREGDGSRGLFNVADAVRKVNPVFIAIVEGVREAGIICLGCVDGVRVKGHEFPGLLDEAPVEPAALVLPLAMALRRSVLSVRSMGTVVL